MALETPPKKRRDVRNRIAILLAALGLMFGAVSCGGMEMQEDQDEQQEQDD
jgi:hypothetical protein